MKLSEDRKNGMTRATGAFWRLGGLFLLAYCALEVIYRAAAVLAPPQEETAAVTAISALFDGAIAGAVISALSVALIAAAHLCGETRTLPPLRAATSILTAKLCVRFTARAATAALLWLAGGSDGYLLKMGASALKTAGAVSELLLLLAFLCASAATFKAVALKSATNQ